MDPSAFDTLVRSFATADTRRRVLRRLAALPPVAGLGLLLGEGTAGRGRSHGRNRGHHPGKGKDNRKGKRKGKRKDHPGAPEDDCGGCPTGQVCCGTGQTAACCDPRSCCFPAGGGGGLACCPRPTCCLTQGGPVCCLGICEIDGSGNFFCR